MECKMNGHLHSHAQTPAATEGRTIRWAGHYDVLVRLLTLGKEKSLRDETIRKAAIPLGASVLDVGCGTGTLALLAKVQVGNQGKVYGIDPAPEMIDAAQNKAHQQGYEANFQVGVIEALPFPDNTFDVVLSSFMFHHLPPTLQRRGLSEIYRVLKPGGRLLIADMKRPTTWAERMTMMMLIHQGKINDIYDLVPLMEKAGFVKTQMGSMRWNVIGYVQGQRA
jgi:ubiquinone/menaquinone biosynthesis C-methylase UbiE